MSSIVQGYLFTHLFQPCLYRSSHVSSNNSSSSSNGNKLSTCCPQWVYPAAGAVENSTGLSSGATPSRPLKDTSNHPAKPVTGGAPFLKENENAVVPSPLVSSKLHVCKSSSEKTKACSGGRNQRGKEVEGVRNYTNKLTHGWRASDGRSVDEALIAHHVSDSWINSTFHTHVLCIVYYRS